MILDSILDLSIHSTSDGFIAYNSTQFYEIQYPLHRSIHLFRKFPSVPQTKSVSEYIHAPLRYLVA